MPYRKIISWILIVMGSLLLGLSVIGIGVIWIYRVPWTNQAVARLQEVDKQLADAQAALHSGREELQRTLRIIEAAEKSLSSLKEELVQAKILTDEVNGTLNTQLLPGLQATRDQIGQLNGTLQGLRDSLQVLNDLPFVNLDLPGDQFLSDMQSGVDDLDKQVGTAQDLIKKASTFVSDTSYLMGGDLGDTKKRIQELLDTVTEYDEKLGGWHEQLRGTIASVPRWINQAAVGLTLFLLWFSLSQFGLILHGLALQQGYHPLAALRLAQDEQDMRRMWIEEQERVENSEAMSGVWILAEVHRLLQRQRTSPRGLLIFDGRNMASARKKGNTTDTKNTTQVN
jgi:hypothetical protein